MTAKTLSAWLVLALMLIAAIVCGVLASGGTPLYVCAQCGGGQHLYGVEYPQQALICPKCGSINLYPWEKMRWLEDEQ